MTNTLTEAVDFISASRAITNRLPSRTNLENHWMPFTDNKSFKQEPRLLVRGEGIHLWNNKGERLIDGSSGLFSVPCGHCRPEIAAAVHKQLLELDYTSPFLRGHPKSFELANRLAAMTPEPLNHIFYGNSGSEAVDTAMKIVMAYNYARRQSQKNIFVSRERAYHGVNIGGTSLGGIVKNREAFTSVLPGVTYMRSTATPDQKFIKGQPADGGKELASDLLRIVQMYGENRIAACFVEPIAGSTGVLVPPEGYLERLRQICDQYDILLVFDEVITGFGRTGSAFAAQEFDVTPDIITMSKAMTNAAQPMSGVAVHDRIYDTVVNGSETDMIEFFHGYTYSGHPAACAASLATLDIYEKENLFQRAKDLSGYFLDSVFALQDHPLITDIRGYGMLAAFDLSVDEKPGRRGHDFQKRLFDAGVHVKTTGDAALIAPPFVIEKSEIDDMCGIIRETLDSYTRVSSTSPGTAPNGPAPNLGPDVAIHE